MKHKIAVKLAALAVTLTCVLACAAGVLVACDKPEIEPHDVEIVLINPHTGEPMSRKEYIEEPPAGTPIEVKIKDLVTGEYLTDDDLPETTLADSITIGIVYYFDWDDNYGKRYENYYNLWPGYDEVPDYCRVFKIAISFDCRPDNPENPREFQRKYTMESLSCTFEYI